MSEYSREAEKEIVEENTMKKIGNSDFSTKPTNYYNLDKIISLGYRVKSVQATRNKGGKS